MRTQNQEILRMFTNTRYDFQSIRKAMCNRLGVKADGTAQDVDRLSRRVFRLEDIERFSEIKDNIIQQEKEMEKLLKSVLKRMPIWNKWLSKVKGIGPSLGGVILGEFDIHKATTVSKMWQYGGLNPGLVRGKKMVDKHKYKESMGVIVGEREYKGKGTKYIVLTDEWVRGDKPTKGFILPYNKFLKACLLGESMLASQFIRQKTYYANEFYYPYKERLANSNKLVEHRRKGGKVEILAWREVSPQHRDMAAKRYMVKMFLVDLYKNWRKIEGLEVREPYCVEYLGKEHEDLAVG